MDTEIRLAPPKPSFSNFDSLERQIASLTYWNCRLFLAHRVGPDKYPHFQYKYKALPVDSASPRAKELRDIVLESRLWLSSPRDFNDPFDMTAHVLMQGTTGQIRMRFKQLIEEKSGLPWKKRRVMLDTFMARPRQHWEEAIKKSHAKNHEQTGIFSFAGDPRSVLMWSHYGNHHTGVCLQFDVARDPGVLLGAVPVSYFKDYPVFNWARDDTQVQLRQSLLNKFDAWAYECESRIIWPGGAHTYLPVKPSALVGLILGCRATDSSMREVDKMLAERAARGLPDVRVYRAVKHERKYALVIKRT